MKEDEGQHHTCVSDIFGAVILKSSSRLREDDDIGFRMRWFDIFTALCDVGCRASAAVQITCFEYLVEMKPNCGKFWTDAHRQQIDGYA
jgi:hypothetical protein